MCVSGELNICSSVASEGEEEVDARYVMGSHVGHACIRPLSWQTTGKFEH